MALSNAEKQAQHRTRRALREFLNEEIASLYVEALAAYEAGENFVIPQEHIRRVNELRLQLTERKPRKAA